MHYYCLSTASADSFGLEGSADSCCGAGSERDRQTDWWSHKPHFPFWGK
jgi:hypothetical protein